jgi:hypothetical protein
VSPHQVCRDMQHVFQLGVGISSWVPERRDLMQTRRPLAGGLCTRASCELAASADESPARLF